MISGDLNPGDNTFHCLIARDRGTLMGVLCSNFFFFQIRRKPTLFTPKQSFSPLFSNLSKGRALTLADKFGNETHKYHCNSWPVAWLVAVCKGTSKPSPLTLFLPASAFFVFVHLRT